MKNAKDIMTSNILTVTPETTVTELAKLLSSNNINGAPVLDSDDTLLGVVTENDLIYQKKNVHIPTVITILDSFIYLENPEKMEKEMLKIAGSTVNDIYTKPCVTVTEETSIEDIATIMAEQNIHTLPVIKDEKLVGVIGKKDIIKTLIR